MAKRCGYFGRTEIEGATIDALCEHVRDCKDVYQKAKAKGDEDKEKYFTEAMPEFMAKVEKCLSGPGPFLVGDSVSYADFCYLVFITEFFDNVEGAKAATGPKVMAAINATLALPGVKAWQAKRPETPF